MHGNLSFLQTKILGRRSNMNWKSALTGAACALLALPSLGDAQSAKIKMGSSLSPPSLESITPYVAVEKGFFKKYGLDVEIVEFRGDVVGTKALLSNDIDVLLNVGATSAIVSASQGAKVHVWVVPHPVTPYHFVARKEAGGTIRGL